VCPQTQGSACISGHDLQARFSSNVLWPNPHLSQEIIRAILQTRFLECRFPSTAQIWPWPLVLPVHEMGTPQDNGTHPAIYRSCRRHRNDRSGSILDRFRDRKLGNRNVGSVRSSPHPLPQCLQQSQGILPILEVNVDFVGTAATQPNNRRSVLRLVSVYAHKGSLTVVIVDNSLHFVKDFSRFVLKWLATHVYNSLRKAPQGSQGFLLRP